jgi:preprotein translocase SecE subunit
VARDRKRAKQRRARRGTTPGARPEHTPAAAPGAVDAGDGASADGATAARAERERELGAGRVERADLPGALEHAGDVDEFDAAIIAGAGGVAANAETLSETEIEAEAEAEGDLTEDELQEGAGGGRGTSNGVSPEQASGAPIRKGNRAIGFLRASWAELQRVQWPDRRHVFQATAVVLGFVAIAGAYLGLADYVAKEIVEAIL